MKSFYNIMTRYITRSKYTEDSSVDDIGNTFKKYGITSYKDCFEPMKKITGTYVDPLILLQFIRTFYNYREFLSYNSRVYIIKLYVSKHMYDLENMKINGKRLYDIGPDTIYTEIPLVVLLSNDDTIIPIPISTIYHNNGFYNYDCYYKCKSGNTFYIHDKTFYDIYYYDIGSVLFYCDYMFDDFDEVICTHSCIDVGDGEERNINISVPSGLIDFISADRPSLEHYAIDHRKFNIYKLPKFIEYINSNINSIVSENSPPELVKIFNELTSHEEFEPKYKSPTQIKKELARKRIQELEQELNELKNDIND